MAASSSSLIRSNLPGAVKPGLHARSQAREGSVDIGGGAVGEQRLDLRERHIDRAEQGNQLSSRQLSLRVVAIPGPRIDRCWDQQSEGVVVAQLARCQLCLFAKPTDRQ